MKGPVPSFTAITSRSGGLIRLGCSNIWAASRYNANNAWNSNGNNGFFNNNNMYNTNLAVPVTKRIESLYGTTGRPHRSILYHAAQ